jgi:hypothetical protein
MTLYEQLKPKEKAIIELAKVKDERGVYRYTYSDIAEMLGFPRDASWAAKVSAICLENGIRRSSRADGAAVLAPEANETIEELEGNFIAFLLEVRKRLGAILDNMVELDRTVEDASKFIVEYMKNK